MRRRAVALLMLAMLGPLAQRGAAQEPDRGADWRRVATLPDRDRLRRLRDAWVEGIRLAYAKGAGPAIRAEGGLLDPDTALADPAPPPGVYRCRIFKLGGMRGLVVSGPVACQVMPAGSALAFSTLGTNRRTAGRLFADTDIRGIYLGALALPEEARVLPYGRDGARDMAGVLKRVGPRQWRIALPYPRFDSTIDVIELVPAP